MPCLKPQICFSLSIIILLILFPVFECQEDKDTLLRLVEAMKQTLTDMEALVKQVETLPVLDYLDQNTQWELLPEANFRKQLMDCSLKSGYLAFHPLLFDQVKERLPEKVFFATLDTNFVDNNFAKHKDDCKIWKRGVIYPPQIASGDCSSALPAICLIPIKTAKMEATIHNLVQQSLKEEFSSLQEILDTTSQIISQGTPHQTLFESNSFGDTLISRAEALKAMKTLLQSQTSLLQQKTLVEIQQLRSLLSNLNQRVLANALQLWNTMGTTAPETEAEADAHGGADVNTDERDDNDADELMSLKQQLKSIRESMANMQADTPNISVGSPTNDVCHNIFEKCKTKIYPFDKVASMKSLIKYSFVNFYVGVTWGSLMFVILVLSMIYTCKQHAKVKKLAALVNETNKKPEQQPLLINTTKLGKALNSHA